MSRGFKDKVGLSPYYLNTRRLEVLSAIDIPAAAQSSLNENNSGRVAAMAYARKVAKILLQTGKIPNLGRAFVEAPEGERVLATTYGAFTFKGSRKAFEILSGGKAATRATFTGRCYLVTGSYQHMASW